MALLEEKNPLVSACSLTERTVECDSSRGQSQWKVKNHIQVGGCAFSFEH